MKEKINLFDESFRQIPLQNIAFEDLFEMAVTLGAIDSREEGSDYHHRMMRLKHLSFKNIPDLVAFVEIIIESFDASDFNFRYWLGRPFGTNVFVLEKYRKYHHYVVPQKKNIDQESDCCGNC